MRAFCAWAQISAPRSFARREQERLAQDDNTWRETLALRIALAVRAGPAGDGGDDRDAVALAERRVFFLHVANVFFVDVDVDEGPQLALVGVEMAAQLAVLFGQVGQGLGDGFSVDVNRSALAG